MSDPLKPCPFCGGKAVLSNYRMVPHEKTNIPEPEICDGKWHFVWCEECRAHGNDYLTNEKAIEAWNRRVSE